MEMLAYLDNLSVGKVLDHCFHHKNPCSYGSNEQYSGLDEQYSVGIFALPVSLLVLSDGL
jgi:hypothetical protein